jgi:hypothetical protein
MSANRTCQDCGMLLDGPGEFHPHVFCVLKKAGYDDPWGEMRWIADRLGVEIPARPPLVRKLTGPVSS